MPIKRLISRHDDAEFPRFIAQDVSGMPIDLTGSTVTYTAQETDGTAFLVLVGPAAYEDQVLFPGQGYYPWRTGETGANQPRLDALPRGEFVEYEEQWQVVYPGGRKETFPSRPQDKVVVRITADLDNV